jgi:two-component system LytT family response regulator
MTLRILVADDEPVALRHLVRLLEVHPELTIVAKAKNGLEALTAIEKLSPDVAFLDIQMPGLDAFELLQRLRTQPLVVFTTAYDEYALAAFRENTLDYLLKPISPEDLSRAVGKLLKRFMPPMPTSPDVPITTGSEPHPSQTERVLAHLLQRLKEPAPLPSQLLVSIRDTLRPIGFDQIVVLEAYDKTTRIHTLEQVHESQTALSELQARLPESDFLRIHRRHIVNRRFISALRWWGNRQLKVELTVPFAEELLVSRRCCEGVLLRMGAMA